MSRVEHIGRAVLHLGDCLEVMRELGPVDHVISDPPYEAVMQNKWGVLSRNAPSSHVRHDEIGFDAIDGIREEVAQAVTKGCQGWAVLFAWRRAFGLGGTLWRLLERVISGQWSG